MGNAFFELVEVHDGTSRSLILSEGLWPLVSGEIVFYAQLVCTQQVGLLQSDCMLLLGY